MTLREFMDERVPVSRWELYPLRSIATMSFLAGIFRIADWIA